MFYIFYVFNLRFSLLQQLFLGKIYIQSTPVIAKSKGPSKNFEISVLRHIRCVVLRKIQFEQPKFTNDYVI